MFLWWIFRYNMCPLEEEYSSVKLKQCAPSVIYLENVNFDWFDQYLCTGEHFQSDLDIFQFDFMFVKPPGPMDVPPLLCFNVQTEMRFRLRIELTYQFQNYHFREIFMFYCPGCVVCYCPIIRIDFCVILWKMTFFPNFFSYHVFAIYVGGASLGCRPPAG